LVAQNVDVIVTYAQGVPIARKATSTIRLCKHRLRPRGPRHCRSLARPSGNVTGLTFSPQS